MIVGTVYGPSDGTVDASRTGLPPWSEVVEVLAELNAELRGPAQGEPPASEPGPVVCNVIGPNAWGASAVRTAFGDVLHTG